MTELATPYSATAISLQKCNAPEHRSMVDPRLKLLLDAIQAIELAIVFLDEQSLDAYSSDQKTRSAVERQLEIVGEACQRMAHDDPSMRERVVELGLAIGLRNRIIHGYDRVEHALVFDTLTKDLPLLAQRLQAELDRFGPPPAGP